MSYPQPEKGGYDAGFGQQAPPPAFGQQAPPPGYQPTGYPNQAYNPGPHQEHHQMHLQNTTIVTGQPAPAVNTVIVSAPPIRPASYLGLAIFVTLCCNLPFGIVAIVFSIMSSGEADSNNMEAARSHGRISMWISIAGILVAVGLAIFLIVYFTVIVASAVTTARCGLGLGC